MGRVYQPIVINETESLLSELIESKFFEEYEIDNLDFAREYLLEVMNKKYIDGLIGDGDLTGEIFNEEEFTKMLQEIIAGTVLHDLKQNGYINSYEDDETEETFFLTEKGKEYLKNNKNEDLE
jgi:hypothetical protein